MATLDEIGQEKQRVSERLARLDTERARLADQLGELEIAERVLTRSGRAVRTKRRRRGGLATPAPVPGGDRRGRLGPARSFEAKWGKRYPAIGQAWRRAWGACGPAIRLSAGDPQDDLHDERGGKPQSQFAQNHQIIARCSG